MLKVFDGLRYVDLDPISFLVYAPEGIECFRFPLIGTSLEPSDGKIFVRLDPMPVQQALRLQPVLVALIPASLRRHVAKLGGLDIVPYG